MHLTCAHQNVPFVHQVRIRKNLAKVVAVLVNQEHTQAMEQHFAKNVCLELVQINLMVLLLVLLALLDIMQVRDIHLVINARQDIIQTTALLIVKYASLEPMLRFTEVLYA